MKPLSYRYYPETDSLYIDLRPEVGADVYEAMAGVVVDVDATGLIVGLDIDHASTQLGTSDPQPADVEQLVKYPTLIATQ
ncbi:MAG: DUF2283 domain-containing protein [Thermostichus sp. DG02_5_bins_236]